VSPDADQPDMVGTLIDNILKGKKIAVKPGGSTVALGNRNEIQKDESAEEEKNQEEIIKKTTEAGKKKDQEERAKIDGEARRKKDSIERNKIHAEEAAKQFDDDLHNQATQAKMKGKEEMNKLTEQAEKKVEEASNKKTAQLAAAKRAEALLDAQTRAGESQIKAVSEMEKKKAAEAIKKSNDEAALKLDESQKKFEVESGQKKAQEDQTKKLAEQTQKKKMEEKHKEQTKKAEEHQKKQEAEAEQNKKAAEKQAEENEKQRRANAVGRWCTNSCQGHRVDFRGAANSWFNCPDGNLLTGIYRSGEDGLHGIYYYYCCKPCREDASAVLDVPSTGCVEKDVGNSMSQGGWKQCDDNKYIQGLYRTDCFQLSCLTKFRCCDIHDSKSRKQCGGKNSWYSSFQYGGWSNLDQDNFAIGFYTDGNNGLNGIRMPHQCTFAAYP